MSEDREKGRLVLGVVGEMPDGPDLGTPAPAGTETVTERGPCTECGTPHDACVGPDYCCDECLHLDANWDGYEQPVTAPVPAGPTDTREALREAIARALWEGQLHCFVAPWDELSPNTPTRADYRAYADAVLALPAVRDALAAQETLRRVEAMVAFYDRHEYASLNVDDLRRALDGDQ